MDAALIQRQAQDEHPERISPATLIGLRKEEYHCDRKNQAIATVEFSRESDHFSMCKYTKRIRYVYWADDAGKEVDLAKARQLLRVRFVCAKHTIKWILNWKLLGDGNLPSETAAVYIRCVSYALSALQVSFGGDWLWTRGRVPSGGGIVVRKLDCGAEKTSRASCPERWRT